MISRFASPGRDEKIELWLTDYPIGSYQILTARADTIEIYFGTQGQLSFLPADDDLFLCAIRDGLDEMENLIRATMADRSARKDRDNI